MNDPLNTPQWVAAVDLGSNSFHIKVARVVDGQLQVVDRMREMVRLAAGLDEHNFLKPETAQSALECLQRFGQRLRDVPGHDVRVVGTNTLRRARKIDDFLTAGEEALGHPIEIIGGREEARLIYLGVAHGVEQSTDSRLVIDIGGGSTEVIIGRQFDPLLTDSLHMGCVSFSEQFFKDGKIRRKAFKQAQLRAELEFEPLVEQYKGLGWDAAIGSSGTIRAAAQVILDQGWSKTGITSEALERLGDNVVQAGDVKDLAILSSQPSRAQVFPGGLAILTAAFKIFGIERMSTSNNALREGVLYDLLGRIGHEDVRDKTIRSMQERYRVDTSQAERVSQTASYLLQQVASAWGLGDEESAHLLHWAAQLHEVGVDIAHSQYHKHGGYLLAYSDLPGFSKQEQELLSSMVRTHRRKLSVQIFEPLPRKRRQATVYLSVLLRLAVLLNRSRARAGLPGIAAAASEGALRLAFPPQWLEGHALTVSGLEEEVKYLKSAGITLTYA